jgi:hypothetical protein
MTTDEIVKAIFEFRTTDRLNGPTVEGFAKAIQTAIETKPNKFLDEIERYTNVPYIYAYSMLRGLQEAWKNNIKFDWNNALTFCDQYIDQGDFRSGKLKVNDDGWGADHKLVVGEIGCLITAGTQKDEKAFDPEYLSFAKTLLFKLIPFLIVTDNFKSTNMDYPTYTLNSPSGKVLRALLDLSLRKARLTFEKDVSNKWDDDTKEVFVESLSKGIIDAYILLGMYYQQFFFLDYNWTSGKFKEYYELDSKYWLATMGGLFFANPPFNKDVYLLMFPHYERAIIENIDVKNFPDQGIARHIGVFYLRGYENLTNDSLVAQFVKTSSPENVNRLISFFRQQEQYIKQLEDRSKYQALVIELWQFILNVYENSNEENNQKLLSHLNSLIVFVEHLDNQTSSLISRTVRFSDRGRDTHMVIASLILLKERGDAASNAVAIGDILNSLTLSEYFSTQDEKQILKLIEFLFIHSQSNSAIKFCNRLAIKGYEFHKDTFTKYNSNNR